MALLLKLCYPADHSGSMAFAVSPQLHATGMLHAMLVAYSQPLRGSLIAFRQAPIKPYATF